MATGRRVERLGGQMRDEIAGMVARELKDPRLGFVTVTRVELAADLGSAKVYVGVLGDAAARERSLVGLRQAAGFIRRELGRRIRIHHVPELRFVYDHGLEAADRVARLLQESGPAREEEEAAPGDEDE